MIFKDYSIQRTASEMEETMQAILMTKLAALEQPLRERGLTSLSLFGSFISGGAQPESDVDVLIQVASERRFSLIDLIAVKNFLEEQVGASVDVVTNAGLDPLIRDRVLSEARRVF